jgi:hypothetical protein
MRFDQVKSSADIQLDGVNVEIEKLGATINSVVFTDAAGKVVKVQSNYGLSVYVPSKPKTKDAYAVRGTVLGIAVDEPFADEWEADRRKRELEEQARGDYKIDVVKVQVPADEDL